MLTADQLRALKRIHRAVFDAFTYVPDPVKWKSPDYWVSKQDILSMSVAGRYEGDCDDFALIVRHECRLADLPNRLVFCWVPQAAGYHLVLESDGWTSDCNHPHLTERDVIPYEWISMSGFERGDPWHYIKGFDHTQPWPHLRTSIQGIKT
jgi:predicted transglutaminase-like cysteine proteinase